MYSQSQKAAKEYIIGKLNNNPYNLRFDIDTSDSDSIIIMCNGPTESIRIISGKTIVPDCILNCVRNIYSFEKTNYVWLYMIRALIADVFKIYGMSAAIDSIHNIECKIMGITNYILTGTNTETSCLDIIFPYYTILSYEIIKQMINKSPLLILLDPIQYFHYFSLNADKYSLNPKGVKEVYKLFITYFPEKNPYLLETYLTTYMILQHYFQDIRYLVLLKLIDLC